MKSPKSFIFRVLPLFFFTATLISAYAQHSPNAEKWQSEIRNLETLPLSASENTILFVGSSSVRLWESISTDMLPYQAIARGYGGAKLSDFSYYVNRIVGPHQCGAIAVFVANDITGSNEDVSPRRVLKLFKKTLKMIRKSQPEIPVFWIEITPTPARWKSWEQISRANHLIRQFCERKNNLFYVPTSHCFLNEQRLPDKSYFVSDLLHLNQEGYQLWSRCIKETFDKAVPHLRNGL